MPLASCPYCSEPEAFGGVETVVVEGGCGVVEVDGGVFVGGACCGGVGVSMGVVDGDFVQQEEPFDGAAVMRDRHAPVVAEQVSDLGVESFEA
ncbi:hypothetical protein AVW09_02520 [Microbacterium sp. T32]|nr:hypothetical protein AVW09_02520 [Microbacterium sp. T32]